MPTIVIDPVTRIEGHLRVDLEVEGGAVVSARSSGTSFRGFERILAGRSVWDAPQVTQRICGVCPIAHAETACLALEDALAIPLTSQARLLRNVIQASNLLASHVLHFYHLSLLDYVEGPDRPPFRPQTRFELRLDRARNEALVGSFVEALGVRRAAHALGAHVGGRLPHPTGIVPGGATARPTATELEEMAGLGAEIAAFVAGRYRDDVALLAETYPELEAEGAGPGSYLSFGALPDGGEPLLRPGVVLDGGSPAPVDLALVAEHVGRSWLAGAAAHPSTGSSEPQPGRSGAYSWMKAPRYDGRAVEVGPLARAVVGGRAGAGRGVMARHRARQQEAELVAAALRDWLAALEPATAGCPEQMAPVPAEGTGIGLTEAPRGALGHWLSVAEGRIGSYQVVSPTTWNASPADDAGRPGPLEHALSGLELAEPESPIEALRVVRSFDPCLQCAVH